MTSENHRHRTNHRGWFLKGRDMRRSSRPLLVFLAIATAVAILPAAPAAAQPTEVSAKFAADVADLPGDAPYSAFVHFRPDAFAGAEDLLRTRGLTVTSTFNSVGVVFATGVVDDFQGLRNEPSVIYLEADKKLHYLGDTAPWATRVRVAHEPVMGGPFFDPDGRVLDGREVGVAVIDSGIDATHPDLKAAVRANYEVVCGQPCVAPVVVQEAPNTDSTSGHGTHVAGIIAGDGTASEKTYRGTAPGASLFGFGAGESQLVMLAASEALDYILENYESFAPRIRVVNNSYGDNAGTAYDPNSVFSKLVKALVEKGVLFTFAAGNGGGNGSADRTSSMCKDPTPGVVCIANYNDGNEKTRCYASRVHDPFHCDWKEAMFGAADRNSALFGTSSRGKAGSPETYPDISAPGTGITSTCLDAAQPFCAARLYGREASYSNVRLGERVVTGSNRWTPWYSMLTGTSMAAAHVAGAAALFFQADPSASPAAIEEVMKDGAHKFERVQSGAPVPYEPDPANPGGTTSYDRGAGLLDVLASLREWDVPGTTIPLSGGEPRRIISDRADDAIGSGAADIISLDVIEEDLGFKHKGLRYTYTLRDADDVPSTPNGAGYVTLHLSQLIDGKGMFFTTTIQVFKDRVQAVRFTGFIREDNTAPAVSVSRDSNANTISFFVPYALLADPSPGSAAHHIYAGSSVGPFQSPQVQDYAPGGVGPEAYTRPQYGAPYSVLRAPEQASEALWTAHGYRRPGKTTQVRESNIPWYDATSPPALTADGRYIAFQSSAPVGGIIVQDAATGQARRVSISSTGAAADGWADRPAISAAGRFVTFISNARNLVPDDTNGVPDVFVHDRDKDEDGVFDEAGAIATERVSISSEGTQMGSPSKLFGIPSISADGRHVVFSTNSPDLVAGDTNRESDVFVHDRKTRTTEIASVTPSGTPGEDASLGVGLPTTISADGRYVCFFSEAQDLVPDDTNGQNRENRGWDVFVRDRQENSTVRVSVADDGSEIPASGPILGALYSSISADGRFVAFISESWDLVPEDSNGDYDVFVHDRDTDENGIFDESGGISTTRANVSSSGEQANEHDKLVIFKRGLSNVPSISGDGRFVAFESWATNLVSDDGNGQLDAFLHDRFTGVTDRISVSTIGAETGEGTFFPTLSSGGRHVAFGTYSPPDTMNYYHGPEGGYVRQLYRRDRGPTLGVAELGATLSGHDVDVSGWATFSGGRVAKENDAAGDAIRPEADLISAELVYRPEVGDVLTRLRLADLPSVDPQAVGVRTSAAPGLLYGLSLTSEGVRYEARATVPQGHFGGDASGVQPQFELFRCEGGCTKVKDISGSIGTVGDEVWLSIPRRYLGPEEASELSGIRAFVVTGHAGTTIGRAADEIALPDSVLAEPSVAIGFARADTAPDAIEFRNVAELSKGRFADQWNVANAAAGTYDVWVRACHGERCEAVSRPIIIEGAEIPTTSISFTDVTAAVAQFSDATVFEAQLLDHEGLSLAGEDIVFTLSGLGSAIDFTTTTDEAGLARTTPVILEAPGEYELIAAYGGAEDGSRSGSTTTRPFTIAKEETVLALSVDGNGNRMEVVAHLSDSDTPSAGLGGRVIEFFADGSSIGEATTSSDGTARVPVPPGQRGRKVRFEATFEGDDFFLNATGETTSKETGPPRDDDATRINWTR